MNPILKKTIENAKYLIPAIGVSAVLYLLLPVSYYLFHSEMQDIMNAKKIRTVKVDTIQLKKKKEREDKQIKKKKKENVKEFQKRFLSRFDLDLSVMSANGSGAAMLGQGFDNVIEEGDADVPPIKRIFIPPRYPTRAKEEGIEGKVVAKLLIDESGNVLRVKILKTPRFWGFDNAVIDAAKKWRFEPAKLNNLPVKVWATQVIEFKL